MDISLNIAFTLAAFALFVVVHIVGSRFSVLIFAGPSAQKALMVWSAFAAATVSLVSLLAGVLLSLDLTEIASHTVFSGLVFGALAYAYFHVFNLSETGRRIRLLVELLEKGSAAPEQLEMHYSSKDMVHLRLIRLEKMGQIRRNSRGKYVVRNGFLLVTAILFSWLGGALFPTMRKSEHSR